MDNSSCKILVVDDEMLPRTLLSTNLREAGYDITETDSGDKALKLLRDNQFDLVLLDLVMPVTDGFQVLRQMKADNILCNIPVVVVSASDDMNSVVRCIEMGAVDHLSKPFDPVLLHTRIRSALAVRHVERERLAGAEGGDLLSRLKIRERKTLEEISAEEGMNIFAFLRALFEWSKPYRRQLTVFAALILVALGIEAALPLGFKFITDDALIPHNFRVLVITLAVLLTALAIAAIVQVCSDFLYVRLATNVLNDLRFNMYRHIQRLSMGYFTRVSAGAITARFTTDLAAVENTVMLCFPITLGQFIIVVFSLGFLFIIEWKLALFSIVGLYVSYKFEQFVEKPASRADVRMKEQQAGITAVLQETVSAQSAIKILRLQNIVTERFKHQMVNFYRTAARACFLSYMTERVPNRCVALFGLVIIAAGALLTFHGYLTLGELIAFQVLLTGLNGAVGELTWSVPYLVRAAGGMNKIEQLLNEKPDVVEAADAHLLPRPECEITFNNVTFGYTESQSNLKNVTMTIPMNSSALLVGPSGSGKSTVLNLLIRFYDPREGYVAIDGHGLRTVTQDSLRQYMSVVLQENFLFNTTIRENIRMGKHGASDAEVEAAAKSVGLHDIIMGLSDKYDTIVGERGGKLSGGQRQRLAIARAILQDPPILLLDEATSAFDPSTAGSIDKAIELIGKGRTVISVTHRLDSAPRVDCIFVFQEGRLVEQGRHEDLLKRNGPYAQLWNKQAGSMPNASH